MTDPVKGEMLPDLSERVDPQQLHARAVIASRMLEAFISRGEYEEDVSAFLFERDRLRAEVERLEGARDADEIKAAVGHDPLTCELCHGEGVSAELVSLRAENARRGTALGAIMTFAAATHPAPCGTDACLLCLIESTAKDALRLARPIDETEQPA